MTRYIGITSTVPVEIIYAAGATPVDLNNAFISSSNPYDLVEAAEREGFPRNYCSWIKGIYGALKTREEIGTVVGVMQGDCANTAALMDVLATRGYEIIPFAYPSDKDLKLLSEQIEKMAGRLRTTVDEAEKIKADLDGIRGLAAKIDRMTWQDGTISGADNHLALVNSSDLSGNPAVYESYLKALIDSAGRRKDRSPDIRLALVGVPPIVSDIYDIIEGRGAGVVYNEVQREFSMPHGSPNLVAQYADYTYPYGAGVRAAEIARQVNEREIDGVIHYVQGFCYHQLDDLVFRDALTAPILTLEADKPGPLDARSRLRLEAFIETLSEK